VALPDGADGRAVLVDKMALADETTTVATGTGDTAEFTMLHRRTGNPVDARVTADGLVHRVDEDDLEELVDSILVNPVRVKDAEGTALAADTLLSDGAEVASLLDATDTHALRLTVSDTLGKRALAATTADTNTVDDVTLLGLVAETASLIGAGRAGRTVDRGELAVFPATHTKEEAHAVGLLLLPEFLEILVGTHDESLFVI